MTHQQAAEQNFLKGYNCCQAVLTAFADDLNLTEEEAARLGSAFGGGIGGLRQTCGAFTAVCLIDALTRGYVSPTDREGKQEQYRRIQAFARAFTEENGSILCGKLLRGVSHTPAPMERTPAYYAERPCARYVGSAAKLIDAALQQKG